MIVDWRVLLTLFVCWWCLMWRWNRQWSRSPGKKGSHYNPNSDLFVPNERKDVITSTACWTAMVAILACLSFVMGPVQLLKLYGVPYFVSALSLSDCMCLFSKRLMKFWSWIWVQTFVAWLDLVTYLHHHGHDEKLPWYRGKVKLLFSLLFNLQLRRAGNSMFACRDIILCVIFVSFLGVSLILN